MGGRGGGGTANGDSAGVVESEKVRSDVDPAVRDQVLGSGWSMSYGIAWTTASSDDHRMKSATMKTRTVATIALLAAMLAGCADSTETAINDATEQVRSAVRKAATKLEALLRSPEAPRSADDLAELDHLAPADSYPIVFDRRLDADGLVVADLAVHARGHGLNEYVIVRMCVRLSGTAGGDATVDVADTECSPTLPEYVDPFGTVERVIHY